MKFLNLSSVSQIAGAVAVGAAAHSAVVDPTTASNLALAVVGSVASAYASNQPKNLSTGDGVGVLATAAAASTGDWITTLLLIVSGVSQALLRRREAKPTREGA